MMGQAGFFRPANIGPGWMQSAEPDKSDWLRIKGLTFRHLLPAHGTPIRDNAAELVAATFKELLDI